MDRRRLITHTGIGVSMITSGCLSSLEKITRDEPPIVPREERSVTQFDDWLYSPNFPGNTTATSIVQFGRTVDSHWVVVASYLDTTTEVVVAIDIGDTEPFFRTDYTVESHTYVAIRFNKKNEYNIDISSDTHEYSTKITSDDIDCNSSREIIKLKDAGEVEIEALSEQILCG